MGLVWRDLEYQERIAVSINALRSLLEEYEENDCQGIVKDMKDRYFLYYSALYARRSQFIDTIYFNKLRIICMIIYKM
jgi:hypothetical protein